MFVEVVRQLNEDENKDEHLDLIFYYLYINIYITYKLQYTFENRSFNDLNIPENEYFLD